MVNFYAEDKYMSYRANAYESLPVLPRPVITCDIVDEQYVLNAPLGYDTYLWSTGETSASITVSDTSKYMVWVNHGIGYLGSYPFSIMDASNPCGIPSSVLEANLLANNKIKYVFDLMGRKISEPKANQIYVVKYESGKSELKAGDSITSHYVR